VIAASGRAGFIRLTSKERSDFGSPRLHVASAELDQGVRKHSIEEDIGQDIGLDEGAQRGRFLEEEPRGKTRLRSTVPSQMLEREDADVLGRAEHEQANALVGETSLGLEHLRDALCRRGRDGIGHDIEDTIETIDHLQVVVDGILQQGFENLPDEEDRFWIVVHQKYEPPIERAGNKSGSAADAST